MTIRFRIVAAAGALVVGILGAAPGVPAHAAVTAVPGSALTGPADPYRQGFRKGLLRGDDAAEKQCDYEQNMDLAEPPPRPAPFDPVTVSVPPGHGADWIRGYREGVRRGYADGVRYYCAHGS
jgi:hypothetical protein